MMSEQVMCPFCGGTDVMIGRDIFTDEWYVKCFDCEKEYRSTWKGEDNAVRDRDNNRIRAV